jgi:hypothetical protein
VRRRQFIVSVLGTGLAATRSEAVAQQPSPLPIGFLSSAAQDGYGVALGIVASLARPGGRVTGIVFQTPEGDAKRGCQDRRRAEPVGKPCGREPLRQDAGSPGAYLAGLEGVGNLHDP